MTPDVLEDAVAQLAAAPAMETLDSLLPLPPRPCLVLSQAFEYGTYTLSIILPKDARTDGHYDIIAYEFESGEALKLESYASGNRLGAENSDRPYVSSVELAGARALTIMNFWVLTAEPHQYHGSRWQLWFVPDKGERVQLGEQLFLMQCRMN